MGGLDGSEESRRQGGCQGVQDGGSAPGDEDDEVRRDRPDEGCSEEGNGCEGRAEEAERNQGRAEEGNGREGCSEAECDQGRAEEVDGREGRSQEADRHEGGSEDGEEQPSPYAVECGSEGGEEQPSAFAVERGPEARRASTRREEGRKAGGQKEVTVRRTRPLQKSAPTLLAMGQSMR